MKKTISLFIFNLLLTKSIFAMGIPVMDVTVASQDLWNSMNVLATYANYAAQLQSQAKDLTQAAGLVQQLNKSQGMVEALCAGCQPSSMTSLKSTIDNLNLDMCHNFAQFLGTSSGMIQSMNQLSTVLTSGYCANAGLTGGASGVASCATALQQSSAIAAQQANALAASAQAASAAERNKKSAQEKLGTVAECQALGYSNCQVK